MTPFNLQSSVWTTVSNVSSVCTVFGLSVIETDNGLPNSRFRVSRRKVSYALFLVCVFAVLLPCHILFYEEDETMEDNVLGTFRRVLNPAVMLVAVGWTFYRRQVAADAANVICLCALKFETISGTSIQVDMSQTAGITLIIWFIMITTDLAFFSSSSLLEESTELFTLIYIYLIIVHMNFYIYIVRALLKALTHEQLISLKSAASQNAIAKLHEYERLYHRIYKASHEITDLFNALAVFLILVLSSILVISGYYSVSCLKGLFQTPTQASITDSLIACQWTCFAYTALCLLILPCSRVSSQASEIVDTINELYVEVENEELKKELHRFSILLLHEKITIVPCDLFTMDNGLLLTIVGGALSYIIVLNEVSDRMTASEKHVSMSRNCST